MELRCIDLFMNSPLHNLIVNKAVYKNMARKQETPKYYLISLRYKGIEREKTNFIHPSQTPGSI